MSNPRRANGHRRDKVRARVLARDELCWLPQCRQPVNKTLKTPHPLAPEIHELTPVAQGGDPYDANNCVLTHRRCNQWIGNRTPAQLAAAGVTSRPGPLTTSQDW